MHNDYFQPSQLGREWTYLISWFPSAATTRKSIVTVSSKPRLRDEHQLIAVDAWTNKMAADGQKMEEEENVEPVRIFAKVTKGN